MVWDEGAHTQPTEESNHLRKVGPETDDAPAGDLQGHHIQVSDLGVSATNHHDGGHTSCQEAGGG